MEYVGEVFWGGAEAGFWISQLNVIRDGERALAPDAERSPKRAPSVYTPRLPTRIRLRRSAGAL